MHHFERFTVDLDEKLGDSLLECPQLYHNMGFPGDPKNGIIRGMARYQKRKATITWIVALFSYKKTLKGKTFVTKVY